MRRHHAALLLILGAMAGAACNSSPVTAITPTAPTSPVGTASPALSTGVAISGKVYDTGNRPIGGATVEVLNGPSAGLRTTSMIDGGFNLSGEFTADTQFRATREGHEPDVKNLTPYCERCNPHHWVFFALGLPQAPADIAGDYTVTITTAATCTTLPGHARQRTFTATLVPTPDQPTRAITRFRAMVAGANIVPIVAWEGLWFNVAGDYIELVTGDLHGQPGIVEQTDVNAYFTVDGIATTTLSASGATKIEMALDAQIVHCELKSGELPLGADGRFSCPASRAVTSTVCSSRNHQLVMTRR
ncbi:MAG TPA: carboxypeptidase-like regulatory domain-containing protein [Vicinamibacterales bacterium]